MAPTMDMSRYLDLFLSETREHLAAIEETLARLEGSSPDDFTIHELYRHAHSLKGMAVSMGYREIAELAHGVEDLFDLLRQRALPLSAEMKGAVAKAFDHVGRMIVRVEAGEALLEDTGPVLAALARCALPVPEEADEAVKEPGAGDDAKEAATAHLRVEVLFSKDAALPAARAAVALKRLQKRGRIVKFSPPLAALERGEFDGHLVTVLETRESEEKVRGALATLTDVESVQVTSEQSAQPATAGPARPAGTSPPPGTATGGDPASAVRIRVTAASLDRFLETVGDLIVQRTWIDGRVLGKIDHETDMALQRLKKLTRRLHEDVMALRMLPFDTIAHRFFRSTRELSDSLGKRASLQITGREVLLDRSILEALIDPINHILRNAIDHGIEAPAERRVAAKPEAGTVSITLNRTGDAVTIRIADDGRGMDPDRIRRAALERGFIGPEALRSISDADALMLATIPGISTAGRITGVSGRGVGMDVVRTRVEALGGRILLHSHPGAGTTVEMRLPLTIVVVPAFIVEAAGRAWAVPLSHVRRTIQVLPEQVEQMDGRFYITLRDGKAPLLDLAALLSLSKGAPPFERAQHALVARESGRTVAVAVDRVVGKREVVVRPLRQPLEELREFSGATLLEDGRIALILDLLNLSRL